MSHEEEDVRTLFSAHSACLDSCGMKMGLGATALCFGRVGAREVSSAICSKTEERQLLLIAPARVILPKINPYPLVVSLCVSFPLQASTSLFKRAEFLCHFPYKRPRRCSSVRSSCVVHVVASVRSSCVISPTNVHVVVQT